MASPTIPQNLAGNRPIAPVAKKGDNATIWDASGDPGAALDEDFQAGTIIDTGHATYLALTIKYDCAAATANAVDFFFLVSNASSQPLITADEWAVLPANDVSPTAAVQDDSMPASVDVTVTPEWGRIVTRPGYFRTEPGDNATDKIRIALVVNVRHWKYIVMLAKEHGATATDGTLVVDGALGFA